MDISDTVDIVDALALPFSSNSNVLFVGHINPRKGFLEAIREVIDQALGSRIKLITVTELTKATITVAGNLGTGDRIFDCLRYIDDLIFIEVTGHTRPLLI